MGERDSGEIRFDVQRLIGSLNQIPCTAWSIASSYLDTGVHHGYRRAVMVSAGKLQPHAELFDFVWDVLNPVRDAWLSWIEPGGFIIPHRDPGPWLERWQVPIAASGEWCSPTSTFTPQSGVAFPVAHWIPHAVVNRDGTPRIHIVADRDVLLDIPAEQFETYSVPADMADLIERSRR